eukprot:1379623-Amorphochlora_amoeboformis.AAC.1
MTSNTWRAVDTLGPSPELDDRYLQQWTSIRIPGLGEVPGTRGSPRYSRPHVPGSRVSSDNPQGPDHHAMGAGPPKPGDEKKIISGGKGLI